MPYAGLQGRRSELEMDENMRSASKSTKIKEAAEEVSRRLYEIKMEEYKLEEVPLLVLIAAVLATLELNCRYFIPILLFHLLICYTIFYRHPSYVKSSKYLDDLKNAKLLQSANLLLTHCTNT
jgi:hypothetical protein